MALALRAVTPHTPVMSLKSAAFLAFIGTLLLTILALADFVNIITGVVRGLVPALTIVRAAIYLFASVCVTIFFYVFNRSQS
jgi:hypothetical protein